MTASFTVTSIQGNACLELDSAHLLEDALWRLVCVSTCGSHMTVLRQPPPTLVYNVLSLRAISLHSKLLQVAVRAPFDPGGWAWGGGGWA